MVTILIVGLLVGLALYFVMSRPLIDRQPPELERESDQ